MQSFSIGRVLAVTGAVIVVVGGIAWQRGVFRPFGVYRPANSLMVLMPYKYAGTWVFDDPAVGLKKMYYRDPPKELYAKAEQK